MSFVVAAAASTEANFLELSFSETSEISFDQGLKVDLKSPSYKDGTLSTKEGGVIQNQDLRIQAEIIHYTKKEKDGQNIHFITAEKNLMLQHKGKAYVGEKIEFDLETKTGVIYQGKTYIAPFYIGGEKIYLLEDGTYKVENAFFTTCENIYSTWDIHANEVTVIKNELIRANYVRFRLFQVPTFWLPSFRLHLKKFYQPIVRYQLTWDKGTGPRASMRYQIYSWNDFAFFLRGEYRLRKGFGGALETEYFPEHKRSYLITRSYLASDVIPTNLDKKRRYRLQGEGQSISPSGKSEMHISWDKYSDVLMPGDFKSVDFEINTAKRTRFFARHQESDFIGIVDVRPRVNSFQTIKQMLPMVYTTMRPYVFPKTGIIGDNWTKVSYLDFAYSDDLIPTPSLNNPLRDFNSFRLETHHEIYRPINLPGVTITPKVGVMGIFYSDSPNDDSSALGLIHYGGNIQSTLYRHFSHHQHMLQPYIHFYGLSKPTEKIQDHFIFSMQDGLDQINQLRFGIRNLLFSLKHKRSKPTFFSDLYTYAFFGQKGFLDTLPKIYLTFGWNLPSIFLQSTNAYNIENQMVDFSNLRFKWTANENAAMSIEIRYRSKYDYRKADHENFILDVTREQEEILFSPLSDRRLTLLTHFFFRFNPFWSAHIHSHHGWLRKNEPPYNEWKIDVYTYLTCNWKLRLTYLHTQRDDRVSAGIELLKR